MGDRRRKDPCNSAQKDLAVPTVAEIGGLSRTDREPAESVRDIPEEDKLRTEGPEQTAAMWAADHRMAEVRKPAVRHTIALSHTSDVWRTASTVSEPAG